MGGQSQTTTTSGEPWEASQAGLESVIASAQSLLESGVGSAVNTGSMVTPYSDQSMTGFGWTEAAANSANGYMNSSMDALQQYAGGGQMGANNNAMIEQYASGDFLDGSNNPYFSGVVSNAQDAAQDAVNMQAASAGRYRS